MLANILFLRLHRRTKGFQPLSSETLTKRKKMIFTKFLTKFVFKNSLCIYASKYKNYKFSLLGNIYVHKYIKLQILLSWKFQSFKMYDRRKNFLWKGQL